MRKPTVDTMKTALRTSVRHSSYALMAFPISLIGFILIVTFGSLGIGLAVNVIGLPILAFTCYIARRLSVVDRAQLRSAMRLDPPEPRYRESTSDNRFVRMLAPLIDVQSWLDAGFQLVRLPLGIISFTLVVTWWAGALGGLTYAAWGWAIPKADEQQTLPELIGLGNGYLVEVIWYLLIGLFFVLTLRWVTFVAAWVHAGPALFMLCGRAAMQLEVDQAQAARDSAVASRDATRTAQQTALRRLERDIHDGPQQQLVRLSMDLGRARHHLNSDPERAREILDDAIARSGSTLDELRALSRGIAPPLLVDRGLKSALEEIVTRAPIPVYLEFDVPDELPEHVEVGAYFVVSECLTNIAKHAQATFGSVRVEIEPTVTGRELVVAVTDDGIGGAAVANGSGLAGLADRVRSLEGVLDVLSPAGGPTVIEARIPCG